MSIPKISIILPVYNRVGTLQRCMDSALAQTFPDWELIAVDDASTDDSLAILEACTDPRVRVLRHDRNRGAGPARNTAMTAARGEWFALLDSDDEWLPEKLEAQLAGLGRAPHCKLSSTAYHFLRGGKTSLLPGKVSGSLERALHFQCVFGFGSTLLIHRDLALSLGGFDPDLPRHEDWDWVLRAAEQGAMLAFVAKPLARVHCVDRPKAERFAPSTERFLLKHDEGLRSRGADYRQEVIAYHYESIASMAYEQRQYALGHHYLIRSFTLCPKRNPLALTALPLGVVDWALRTRFIQWAAALRRAWLKIFTPLEVSEI